MIDLHVHSTESDGSCTPERVIELAVEGGLTAVALTDHDTLSGIPAALAKAAGAALRFIPGIEIQIDSDRGEFHLLGLGLDGDRSGLERALSEIQRSREERNLRMVGKFQAAGFPVTMEELARFSRGSIVSRAHFARLLVSKKIASSTDQAFKRYLGRDGPFYEKKQCLALAEAVSLIKRAGGFAVIAHPLSVGYHGPALRQFLLRCMDLGVGGLEAYHPNHPLRDCRKLDRMGRSIGMLITGGSDFHGEHVPHRRMGFSAGGLEVPDALLAELPLRAVPG